MVGLLEKTILGFLLLCFLFRNKTETEYHVLSYLAHLWP